MKNLGFEREKKSKVRVVGEGILEKFVQFRSKS